VRLAVGRLHDDVGRRYGREPTRVPVPAAQRRGGANRRRLRWQNPRPQGNTLAAVAFADSQTGWAVGDAGAVVKTTDGSSWAAQRVPNDVSGLAGVAAASHTVAWATGVGSGPGGDRAVVLATVDGVNWSI